MAFLVLGRLELQFEATPCTVWGGGVGQGRGKSEEIRERNQY